MSNKRGKISVIVPVYNVEEFLPRCLESIVNNSFQDLEIICIDDGSTDNSLEMLYRYSSRDKRIKVLSQKNAGLSSARNEGIKHCTGDWIAFVDSDDWIHKDYFSELLTIQKSKDFDIVVGSFVRTTDCDCLKFQIDNYDIRELDSIGFISSQETKVYVWGRIYRKTLLKDIWFDENEKIEDVVYNVAVAVRNPQLKVAYADLKLYAYYIRENSLVSFINRCDIFRLARSMYQQAFDTTDFRIKDNLYQESLKRCLVTRYDFRLHKEKREARESDILAKECLKKTKNLNRKYIILVYIPVIYRLYRIAVDPTMLKYEIKVKQSIKSNKE